MTKPISITAIGGTIYALYSNGALMCAPFRGTERQQEWQHVDTLPKAKAAEKATQKPWAPTKDHLRLNALFGRRGSTVWDSQEKAALSAAMRLYSDREAWEADLAQVEQYYAGDSEILRTALATLLRNWNTEVTRAQAWLAENKPSQAKAAWWQEAGMTQEEFEALTPEEKMNKEREYRENR